MADGRDLDWAGMYNVRDLGGLPTHDGLITRWGALVRSEGLNRLVTRGVALGHAGPVDLRGLYEAHGTTAAENIDVLLANLNVENYLRDAGMDITELDALKHRLVEPSP